MQKFLLLYAVSLYADSDTENTSQYANTTDLPGVTQTANTDTAKQTVNTDTQNLNNNHIYNYIEFLDRISDIEVKHNYTETKIATKKATNRKITYRTQQLSTCQDKIYFTDANTVCVNHNGNTSIIFTHQYTITAVHVINNLMYIADEIGNLIIVDNNTQEITEIINHHLILSFIEKDDKLLALSNNGSITCFLKDQGIILWHLESTLPNDIAYNTNACIDGNLLYTFSAPLSLSVVDLHSGNTLQTIYIPYHLLAHVYVDDKSIYCITNHTVYQIDKSTYQYIASQTNQYDQQTPDDVTVTVSPVPYIHIFNNSSNIFLSTNREIFQLDTKTLALQAVFQAAWYDGLMFDEKIISSHITDKYIFVNTTHYTICIDLHTYARTILSHRVLNIAQTLTGSVILGAIEHMFSTTKAIYTFN